MEITWLGHSCFRLRGRSSAVVTDPFERSSGYTLPKTTADLVTISNSHPNHSSVADIGGNPIVLDGPGEYEVHGVVVTGFRTTHPRGSEEPLRNTAYVFEIDGVTICHLGDLTGLLNAEQIEMAKDADILLIPAGGHCTIGPSQAAEVISQIEPKIVVPMHYATEVSTMELDPLDRFLHEMGLTELAPQAKLVVTPSSLPPEPTVMALDYPR